ncbi:MAG: substrate-binding domain-containing protein [Lentisphaeria bacterium]|nr:substrate-binding domain-containing protein [Lentisphaeria bacterium]
MADRRKICRRDAALQRLRVLVADLRVAGQVFLPSERSLCDQIGTSRVTLRIALAELEKEGLLASSCAQGRVIAGASPAPGKGRVLFIAQGRGWIQLPAWNRLWFVFKELAGRAGYESELALGEVSEDVLDRADAIIYSGGADAVGQRLSAYAARRGNVIGVQENHVGLLPYVVALDNRAAGRLAAQTLLAAGYQRPAILRRKDGYFGFEHREEGFCGELARALPGYDAPKLHMVGTSSLAFIRDYLSKIDDFLRQDIDALFVAGDGMIELFYSSFSPTRRIPDDFGFIALASSHECLVHQPPITAVGHATTGVAQALVQLLESLHSAAPAPALTLLAPTLHAGATVRAAAANPLLTASPASRRRAHTKKKSTIKEKD